MLRRTLIGAALSGALMLSSIVGCAIRSRNAEPSVIAASAASRDALTPTSNGVIGVLIGGEARPQWRIFDRGPIRQDESEIPQPGVLASRRPRLIPQALSM